MAQKDSGDFWSPSWFDADELYVISHNYVGFRHLGVLFSQLDLLPLKSPQCHKDIGVLMEPMTYISVLGVTITKWENLRFIGKYQIASLFYHDLHNTLVKSFPNFVQFENIIVFAMTCWEQYIVFETNYA